jgi:hypothetical protein
MLASGRKCQSPLVGFKTVAIINVVLGEIKDRTNSDRAMVIHIYNACGSSHVLVEASIWLLDLFSCAAKIY